MKKLFVNKKSGFFCSGKITIYHNKKLFYKRDKATKFNLPVGVYEYLCEGRIYNIPFIKYPLPRLPRPQRNKGGIKPNEFKVHFSDNPNKASIHLIEKWIKFDKNFFDAMNFAQKCFVIYHELGHRFYYDEKKCDTYAINKMLLKGFNPSQIYSAPASTLTCEKRINNAKKQLNGFYGK